MLTVTYAVLKNLKELYSGSILFRSRRCNVALQCLYLYTESYLAMGLKLHHLISQRIGYCRVLLSRIQGPVSSKKHHFSQSSWYQGTQGKSRGLGLENSFCSMRYYRAFLSYCLSKGLLFNLMLFKVHIKLVITNSRFKELIQISNKKS